jgi:hypothetical protein
MALGWMGGPASAQAQGGGGSRPVAAAEAGPRWQDLSPSQRAALKPLERDWAGIDATRKQKWLEVANRYPSMPQAERDRISARMTEWVKFSPAERGQARLNFQNARQITPQERQERWQAYQSLSPEERNKLAERAAPVGGAVPKRANQPPREGVQRKSNIVPNPGYAASPKPVSPSVVQAAPGATTTLISKRPAPPTHQQPGLPKIAATPNFVDKQTLLPQRGAQGAAVVPPATTRAQ